MEKRFKDMDVLRGIGIFLVVFGHSFPDNKFNNNSFYSFVFYGIYMFHMPLYFLISGFFAIKIYEIINWNKYIDFVKKKFKRLIIPYFIFSFIAIPIKIYLNKFASRPLEIGEVFKSLLIYPLDSPIQYFWFIYVMFFIFLIAPIFKKVQLKYTLIITFLLSVTVPLQGIKVFYLSGIIHYMFYFFLGVAFRKYYKKITEAKYKISITLISLAIVSKITLMPASIENFKLLIGVIAGVFGILACINIAKLIENKKIATFFSMLANYSYEIYLISWFTQTAARVVFFQLLKFDYNITIVLMFIFGIIPIIISKYFISKNKTLSKILFGEL